MKPLDALTAATAIAHEIPLVTRSAERFAGIADLDVYGI
jgi:predicted nucleic acid-binding protein